MAMADGGAASTQAHACMHLARRDETTDQSLTGGRARAAQKMIDLVWRGERGRECEWIPCLRTATSQRQAKAAKQTKFESGKGRRRERRTGRDASALLSLSLLCSHITTCLSNPQKHAFEQPQENQKNSHPYCPARVIRIRS